MFRRMMQTWQILQMVNFLPVKCNMLSLRKEQAVRFGPQMATVQVVGAHQQGLQELAPQLTVRI